MKQPVVLEMNGDEFKKLVEQETPDGHINTIPEVMRLLSVIRNDESLEDYIRRIVEPLIPAVRDEGNGVLRFIYPEER